jgi:hypothetical protein
MDLVDDGIYLVGWVYGIYLVGILIPHVTVWYGFSGWVPYICSAGPARATQPVLLTQLSRRWRSWCALGLKAGFLSDFTLPSSIRHTYILILWMCILFLLRYLELFTIVAWFGVLKLHLKVLKHELPCAAAMLAMNNLELEVSKSIP